MRQDARDDQQHNWREATVSSEVAANAAVPNVIHTNLGTNIIYIYIYEVSR